MSSESKKAAQARWYRANKEKVRAVSAAYYQEHKAAIKAQRQERLDPEGERARCAAWRARNPEAHRAACRAWWESHPEARAVYNSRRRAARLGGGGKHTAAQKRVKFAELGNRCFYCGRDGKLTTDHLTPLSRGGTDDIDNIVPACQPCNSRKNNKTLDEFLESKA